ncbi:MAG: epoxyqueuosine reductase QueH [Desulfuromonadaceae bacterium]|nr:epoxyqueuosine reductase QueH [Desulfuromonadaceae bacterium]MDD2856295.1 epoxyqueuosine reductase QueH [Desulfuromonadaceae bacterium]
MRILLHICCGPCALYPILTLQAAGHDVTGFFYNHNIHPYTEYLKRRDTALQMAEQNGIDLIVHDDYDLEGFLANVANEPDRRCTYCYSSRLKATAKAAVKGEFEAFTSSLLYSRYQKHDEINQLGARFGDEAGVAFLYEDFRQGWQQGIKLSKEMGLYRQQYCGCIYSEKERYLQK